MIQGSQVHNGCLVSKHWELKSLPFTLCLPELPCQGRAAPDGREEWLRPPANQELKAFRALASEAQEVGSKKLLNILRSTVVLNPLALLHMSSTRRRIRACVCTNSACQSTCSKKKQRLWRPDACLNSEPYILNQHVPQESTLNPKLA